MEEEELIMLQAPKKDLTAAQQSILEKSKDISAKLESTSNEIIGELNGLKSEALSVIKTFPEEVSPIVVDAENEAVQKLDSVTNQASMLLNSFDKELTTSLDKGLETAESTITQLNENLSTPIDANLQEFELKSSEIISQTDKTVEDTTQSSIEKFSAQMDESIRIITEKIDPFKTQITSIFGSIDSKVGANLDRVNTEESNLLESSFSLMKSTTENLATSLSEIISSLQNLQTTLSTAQSTLEHNTTEAKAKVEQVISEVKTTVTSEFDEAKTEFAQSVDMTSSSLLQNLNSGKETVSSSISDLNENLKSKIIGSLEAAKHKYESDSLALKTQINEEVSITRQNLKTSIAEVKTLAKNKISETIESSKSTLDGVKASLGTSIKNIVDNLKYREVSLEEKIVGKVDSLTEGVTKTINESTEKVKAVSSETEKIGVLFQEVSGIYSIVGLENIRKYIRDIPKRTKSSVRIVTTALTPEDTEAILQAPHRVRIQIVTGGLIPEQIATKGTIDARIDQRSGEIIGFVRDGEEVLFAPINPSGETIAIVSSVEAHIPWLSRPMEEAWVRSRKP